MASAASALSGEERAISFFTFDPNETSPTRVVAGSRRGNSVRVAASSAPATLSSGSVVQSSGETRRPPVPTAGCHGLLTPITPSPSTSRPVGSKALLEKSSASTRSWRAASGVSAAPAISTNATGACTTCPSSAGFESSTRGRGSARGVVGDRLGCGSVNARREQAEQPGDREAGPHARGGYPSTARRPAASSREPRSTPRGWTLLASTTPARWRTVSSRSGSSSSHGSAGSHAARRPRRQARKS